MNGDESARDRTRLAGERTMLAWWRTGLASLAVALAAGRLLPELSDEGATWPFVALGLGFATYAIALFAYGLARGAEEHVRVPLPLKLVAVGGIVLAIATVLLIAGA